MQVNQVNAANYGDYFQMAQTYEKEFSQYTHKQPNAQGIYALDTEIIAPVLGYLFESNQQLIGLAAIQSKGIHQWEMCEFYIQPHHRHQGWGKRFAHQLWNHHPGDWEVKQLIHAKYATAFWRQVIGSYPVSSLQEDIFEDDYWGTVIRQKFKV